MICIAEDRESCEPGVRLLIASLNRHEPHARVQLFCPNPSPEFAKWIQRFPAVTLNTRRVEGAWTKWDVKAQALASLLGRGFSEVVWIDSDIIVCGSFLERFASLPSEVLIATEERLDNTPPDLEMRTRAWSLRLGRTLPYVVNTAVLRVTKSHESLLARWMELMATDAYREAQNKPWDERPLHLLGDQDVLSALLSSVEFAHVDVLFLKRRSDIVQYFGNLGYTVVERFAHLVKGLPTFVHSQGWKPWFGSASRQGHASSGERLRRLYSDLTPYSMVARHYAAELPSRTWLRPASALIAIFRIVGFLQAPLVGLPLALVFDLRFALRTVARALRKKCA